MTHCTVCGAAAREGAKFCTSCGARLVDTVTPTPAPDETATVPTVEPAAEPSEVGALAEPSSDQPVHEATWASTVTGSATGEVESLPDASAQQDAAAVEPAESPEYTASWPGAEDEAAEATADEAPDDVPPVQPDEAWAAWERAPAESAPAGAPGSFATDADQDPDAARTDAPTSAPREIRPSPFATDADQDARSEEDRPAETGNAGAGERSAEQAEADDRDVDHHGASQWESWAPQASGEATVPTSSGDVGASVRRLLDDLAHRIDRLIDPAPVGARGVDADELADQLGRWSSASTDADGLLEVVRAVRTSPRDVDALTRLADRAPDLELLVRHYQAITSGAGQWSRKLRDQGSASTEDA